MLDVLLNVGAGLAGFVIGRYIMRTLIAATRARRLSRRQRLAQERAVRDALFPASERDVKAAPRAVPLNRLVPVGRRHENGHGRLR